MRDDAEFELLDAQLDELRQRVEGASAQDRAALLDELREATAVIAAAVARRRYGLPPAPSHRNAGRKPSTD